MEIYRVDPLQDPRWAELVETHPCASVFHTVGWLEALRRTYEYSPMVFTTSSPAEKLHNGLVFCRVRSWLTGRRMVSLPFSDHCEPLFDSLSDLDFLVGCLQADVEGRGWKYLEVRPNKGHFGGERLGFQPAKLYSLHRLDLRPELGDILKSLDKNSIQRRIRRAERERLVCECGRSENLLREFYRLLLLTRVRHRLPPQPYRWFKNLVYCMGDALQIRVAYRDGISIAAVMTLRFRKVVYYKYGCSDAKFHPCGGMPFLLWKVIQESKLSGAEEFDLGRSDKDNKGLIAFKDQWTHRSTPLVYWRFPASEGLTSREVRNWGMVKWVFVCMPDSLLCMTGRLLYRHIG